MTDRKEWARRIQEARVQRNAGLAWFGEYEKHVLRDDTSALAAHIRSLMRQLRHATGQSDHFSDTGVEKGRLGDLNGLVDAREHLQAAHSEALDLHRALFVAIEEYERQAFEEERKKGGSNG